MSDSAVTQVVEAPPKVVTGVIHSTAPPYRKALCGVPLSGRFADGEAIQCVVCADLDDGRSL